MDAISVELLRSEARVLRRLPDFLRRETGGEAASQEVRSLVGAVDFWVTVQAANVDNLAMMLAEHCAGLEEQLQALTDATEPCRNELLPCVDCPERRPGCVRDCELMADARAANTKETA